MRKIIISLLILFMFSCSKETKYIKNNEVINIIKQLYLAESKDEIIFEDKKDILNRKSLYHDKVSFYFPEYSIILKIKPENIIDYITKSFSKEYNIVDTNIIIIIAEENQCQIEIDYKDEKFEISKGFLSPGHNIKANKEILDKIAIELLKNRKNIQEYCKKYLDLPKKTIKL